MEALKAGGGSVYRVAASADIAGGRVRVNATITTHTTTASFVRRHCYSIARVGYVGGKGFEVVECVWNESLAEERQRRWGWLV